MFLSTLSSSSQLRKDTFTSSLLRDILGVVIVLFLLYKLKINDHKKIIKNLINIKNFLK